MMLVNFRGELVIVDYEIDTIYFLDKLIGLYRSCNMNDAMFIQKFINNPKENIRSATEYLNRIKIAITQFGIKAA